jgi:transposase
LTIVRDLNTGAVLFVGDGKNGESLMDFLKKIHYSKAKIELVAMDMGKAYVKWVKNCLPNANIVVDKIRRGVLEKLDNEQKALLKKQRFTLLRNYEDLKPEAQEHLVNMQATFKELGEAYMMKEALRSIYKTAKDSSQAEAALMTWCETARLLDSKPLETMAKTIEARPDGIPGYWIFGVSGAAMEGFNNKIRHLISQAYGYHDEEYFKLKIFDLPNITIKEI